MKHVLWRGDVRRGAGQVAVCLMRMICNSPGAQCKSDLRSAIETSFHGSGRLVTCVWKPAQESVRSRADLTAIAGFRVQSANRYTTGPSEI